MSETKIFVRDDYNERTPPSFDDSHRKELPWELREEKLLLRWRADCMIRSIKHETKAQRTKIKFSIFGIPSILIPIILGGVSSVIPCNSVYYSVGMSCSGLFSAINMFYNFGKKTEEHFNFTNKFFELSNDIESELSKPKKHRIACCVYMEQIKHQYNSLVKQSPVL
mgnify:CR=1 FL=1|tara:strand:+ start:33 stop:533 length:501 start_codon:yes stop_codon:yes gene_type:complete